jgi:hypothetical protein
LAVRLPTKARRGRLESIVLLLLVVLVEVAWTAGLVYLVLHFI